VRQRKVKADKSWIGATPEGKKELVGLTDGVRESTRSWNELAPRSQAQWAIDGPRARGCRWRTQK
jgi:hypothetical protein